MSCNGFKPSIKQCRDCGADYTQRQYNQYRCPVCQAIKNKQAVRKATAKYAVNHYKLEGLEVVRIFLDEIKRE